MGTTGDTPSLLLTLLTKEPEYKDPINAKEVATIDHETTAAMANQETANAVQINIGIVIDAIRHRRPNLIKDVAQKQLYHVLYEVYEETEKEYKKSNHTLNKEIGMALESAIKGTAVQNPAETLRNKLRGEIIKA